MNFTKSLFVFFVLNFTHHCVIAQSIEEEILCGYDEIIQEQLSNNLSYRQQVQAYNEAYASAMLSKSSEAIANTIYTIPIVFHIIHNGEPQGHYYNPTDEEIQEFIVETSDRFRHKSGKTFNNPFSGVDTEIEFCLATTDPDGNFTTGILRYYEPYLNTSEVVAVTRWDASRYYNMYVYYTERAPCGVYKGKADGDVVLYNARPQSGLMAHETGHYFTLDHTFFRGCKNDNCLLDGDRICDTPPKSIGGYTGTCRNPETNCITDTVDMNIRNPYRSKALGGLGDQLAMLENYMDYTAWCWDAFTIGQKNRMRFDIATNRMPLVNNAPIACASRQLPSLDIGVTDFKLVTSSCNPTASVKYVTIQNYGTKEIQNFIIDIVVNEELVKSFTKSAIIPVGGEEDLLLNEVFILPSENNYIELRTRMPNGQVDGFSNNNWLVQEIRYNAISNAMPYKEEFPTQNWPNGYMVNNEESLQWTLKRAFSSLRDCFGDYYAFVIGSIEKRATASLEVPPIDLTNVTNAAVSFKYGYLQKSLDIQDKLTVSISTDCTNQQTIWSAEGSSLSTIDTLTGRVVYPNCNNLEKRSIDLSSFIGQQNVTLRFIAEGNFESPLALDSIVLTTTTPICAIPRNSHLESKTDVSGCVVWDKVTNGIGYHFQWRSIGSSNWQEIHTNFLSNKYVIRNLSPERTYEWRVRSKCEENLYSDWSASQSFETYGTAAYCPDIEITEAVITAIESDDKLHYTFKVSSTGKTRSDGYLTVQSYGSEDVHLGNDVSTGAFDIRTYIYPNETKIYDGVINSDLKDFNYLILVLDDDKELRECDESNNIFVLELPDFSCLPTLTIHQDPILPSTYQAKTVINSKGTIKDKTTVTFKAGEQINLYAGFHAEAGSNFHALIELCSPKLSLNTTITDASKVKDIPHDSRKTIQPQLTIMPNPVRHQATIEYKLLDRGIVKIMLSDMHGRLIKILEQGSVKEQGKHELTFLTREMPQGLYLVTLQTNNKWQTKKMIVLE